MGRKKFLWAIICILFGLALYLVATSDEQDNDDYLVMASVDVMMDDEWAEVANTLATRHNAEVVIFETSPRESLEQIREAYPRYVAIVDKPVYL